MIRLTTFVHLCNVVSPLCFYSMSFVIDVLCVAAAGVKAQDKFPLWTIKFTLTLTLTLTLDNLLTQDKESDSCMTTKYSTSK